VSAINCELHLQQWSYRLSAWSYRCSKTTH